MTASSLWNGEIIPGLDLIRTRADVDPLFTSRILSPNHEYYIKAVDKVSGTVTLGNPWGWGQDVTLTMDEFQRGFQRLSVNFVDP